MSPVIRNSYAADAALIAAEAVIAARAWLSDEAARARLATMAAALVALARQQAAAAGPAYLTPNVLHRRLAAVETAISHATTAKISSALATRN